MNTLRPIEIVGGGLAGLSLGLALRRHQIPVTLYEAGDYPRHRVCGEFITGLGEETIARLGLEFALHDALRHREVAWFVDAGADAETPKVYPLPSPALGLSRHTLDARLAAAFTEAGGVLHRRTRRTNLGATPGQVLANGRRAGAASRAAWLGLKFHVRGLRLHRELELHLGDHAYVGLARVENDAINVCGLFRRRSLSRRGAGLLLDYLDACGLVALAERLRSAEIVADSFCAVAALAFDRRVPAARDRLSLGDACAMIPPFTGNGMAMAFQSAEAALDPLLHYARHESSWAETCRATNRALRGRFRVRLVSADLVHPFLLRPRQQRWFARLSRARLLPFRSLYATLH